MDDIGEAKFKINQIMGQDISYIFGERRMVPVDVGLAIALVLLDAFALGFADGIKNEAREAGKILAQRMIHFIKKIVSDGPGVPQEKVEQDFDKITGSRIHYTDDDIKRGGEAGRVTVKCLLIEVNVPEDKAESHAQDIAKEGLQVALKRLEG